MGTKTMAPKETPKLKDPQDQARSFSSLSWFLARHFTFLIFLFPLMSMRWQQGKPRP